MKVEFKDPPGVRAGKWAQRWEWEELACFWSACCKTDGDGWIVLPRERPGYWHGLSMRDYSGAPVAHARALLWRREVAWRERVEEVRTFSTEAAMDAERLDDAWCAGVSSGALISANVMEGKG